MRRSHLRCLAGRLEWAGLIALVALGPTTLACRTIVPLARGEYEGAALLGWRNQSGWENESAPLIHLDVGWRPAAWPVGLRLSADLSGFSGDDTGEQTASLGLGLTRTLALVPGRLWGSFGVGRLFHDTDNGELFAPENDAWQASYVELGLHTRLDETLRLGLELRASSGDGPRLGAEELDGDFLDLFPVVTLVRGSPALPPGGP